MAAAGDPVGEGLVASLARPGGNVTGFSSLAIELNTKRLEILKDAVPKLVRVGLLRFGRRHRTRPPNERAQTCGLALKLKLEEIETQADAKGLESAFQTAKQKQVGRDYDDRHSPIFRRKKADRRACRRNTGCRLFTSRRSLSMRAASCPMGRTTMTCTARPPIM